MDPSLEPDKRPAPQFPYAGVGCFVMAGLLLLYGGYRVGVFLVGLGAAWAIFAIALKLKRR